MTTAKDLLEAQKRVAALDEVATEAWRAVAEAERAFHAAEQQLDEARWEAERAQKELRDLETAILEGETE